MVRLLPKIISLDNEFPCPIRKTRLNFFQFVRVTFAPGGIKTLWLLRIATTKLSWWWFKASIKLSLSPYRLSASTSLKLNPISFSSLIISLPVEVWFYKRLVLETRWVWISWKSVEMLCFLKTCRHWLKQYHFRFCLSYQYIAAPHNLLFSFFRSPVSSMHKINSWSFRADSSNCRTSLTASTFPGEG